MATVGFPGWDSRHGDAAPHHEQLVEVVAAGKPKHDHEGHRDPGDCPDHDRQLVERRINGVFSCRTACSIPETRPTSVPIPVAVSIISPRPRMTVEFI